MIIILACLYLNLKINKIILIILYEEKVEIDVDISIIYILLEYSGLKTFIMEYFRSLECFNTVICQV